MNALRDLPRGPGTVHLDVEEGMATLIIDNPRRANAMSPGMMVDLVDCVARLEAAAVAVVLIHGSGARAFCAGGDLQSVHEHLIAPEGAAAMCAVMSDALNRLWRLPAVVVAAVEGAALGGGAEILSTADVVFAADTSLIGYVHASLGVSPGWGGGRRLVHRVGAAKALQVLATGGRWSADEARAFGLVDHIVPNGTVIAAARHWCEQLCAQPGDSVQGAATLVKTWRDRPESGAKTEADVFKKLWGEPAHLSALAKALSK
jgi:enoyl-CoA hydratase/carnithine racemase